MSLACCIGDNTTGGRRRRPDQEGPHRTEIECLMRCCVGASGDAASRRTSSPRYKPLERAGSFDMPSTKKPRKTHRRAFTAVSDPTALDGEPRLVRSGGMRRDWSFEDLGDTKREY